MVEVCPSEKLIDMAMPKSNRCPFCGGAMFLYADPDGYYEGCLECSLQRELGIIAKFHGQPSEMQRELAPAEATESMSS